MLYIEHLLDEDRIPNIVLEGIVKYSDASQKKKISKETVDNMIKFFEKHKEVFLTMKKEIGSDIVKIALSDYDMADYYMTGQRKEKGIEA